MRRTYYLFLVTLLILAACQATGRSLGPIRPAPTAPGPIVNQTIPVAFEQLNGDPYPYRDMMVRVTGAYTRLPLPECSRYSGPALRWALVAGNLRLDARGFEQVLRLAPAGLTLTVDGFWRLYDGPLGCGKEPPAGAAWYLEMLQIVQPNPLPAFDHPGGGAGIVEPPAETTPEPETTPEGGPDTPLPPGAATPTSTPTFIASPLVTATPAIGLTGTPGPVTGTPSVTPSRTPTPTATGGPSPTPAPPGLPTATPGSYPPPATEEPPNYP